MSERKLRRVPKWVSNAERREFATEIAAREYGGWEDASSVLLRLGYAKGIYDAMLTPEDIGTIFNLVREVQVNYNATEGCYPEVLKRFNEIKFKK